MLNKKLSISAFFPCYNDAGSIGLLVRNAQKILGEIASDFEIIVVDDGSADESRPLLKVLSGEIPQLRLVFHRKNKGYGGALKSGFLAARKDWVFYTDGDGQYDVRELARLVEKLNGNIDIVQGFKIKRVDPWYRTILGRFYHNFSKFFFGLKIRDVDCDFRLIKKEAWKKIRDVFIDVHLGDKIQRSIDRGNSITSVAESNIRKLKSARIQTGAIESRLAEFRKYLEDAQEAVNSGDYVAAQDALRSARNSLNETGERAESYYHERLEGKIEEERRRFEEDPEGYSIDLGRRINNLFNCF